MTTLLLGIELDRSPTEEHPRCPLWVISGHVRRNEGMSALGGGFNRQKRTAAKISPCSLSARLIAASRVCLDMLAGKVAGLQCGTIRNLYIRAMSALLSFKHFLGSSRTTISFLERQRSIAMRRISTSALAIIVGPAVAFAIGTGGSVQNKPAGDNATIWLAQQTPTSKSPPPPPAAPVKKQKPPVTPPPKR